MIWKCRYRFNDFIQWNRYENYTQNDCDYELLPRTLICAFFRIFVRSNKSNVPTLRHCVHLFQKTGNLHTKFWIEVFSINSVFCLIKPFDFIIKLWIFRWMIMNELTKFMEKWKFMLCHSFCNAMMKHFLNEWRKTTSFSACLTKATKRESFSNEFTAIQYSFICSCWKGI